MFNCSFCDEKSNSDKLPEGWGRAKGKVEAKKFDITFCPKHRKEAEKKLDLIFSGK